MAPTLGCATPRLSKSSGCLMGSSITCACSGCVTSQHPARRKGITPVLHHHTPKHAHERITCARSNSSRKISIRCSAHS